MLQPTSCGPGPPATGWRQRQRQQQQQLEIYQYEQQQQLPRHQQQQPREQDQPELELEQNATNCSRNVADDRSGEQINGQQQQQQHQERRQVEGRARAQKEQEIEKEKEREAANAEDEQGEVKCWQRQLNVSKSNGKWSSSSSSSSDSNIDDGHNNNNNNIGTTTTGTDARCSKNNLSNFLTRAAAAAAAAGTATTTTAGRTTATAAVAAAVKWSLVLLTLLALLAAAPTKVAAEKSKHYYMQSMCKSHFLQQLYRKIDGAVLWSQNERNLDCIITFQTHSILQRFMLRFDMLQLDCNDHLYVYDGAHAVGNPKIDISCRNTKQTVSSILTRTNFVTLKYVTDGWGTDANGFKLVITSVKDPQHTCKDFTCATREFCIHPDLLCDGINHCGDNSDESVHNLCQSETSSTILGLELTWFVLVVVSAVLVLSACVVGWSICFCRGGASAANGGPQTTAMQMHHAAESNGSSKHLHQYGVHGTLTREHTQLPASGNWRHPAGPSGYRRTTQRNLLKMATKVRPIWCLASFVN